MKPPLKALQSFDNLFNCAGASKVSKRSLILRGFQGCNTGFYKLLHTHMNQIVKSLTQVFPS